MLFCVGIDTYPVETGYSYLRYASRDSEIFAKGLFSESDADFLLKGQVTRSKFIQKFVHWLSTIKGGTAIFYFAGHSYCDQYGTNLVFSDSVDGGALGATSLKLSTLFKLVSEVEAHFLFFLDSCRNTTTNIGVDYSPPNVTAVHAIPRGSQRYEFPPMTKSLPAIIHASLPDLGETFLVSDLMNTINKFAKLHRVNDFIRCEACGDRILYANIFKRDATLFGFNKPMEFGLVVDPKTKLSREDQEVRLNRLSLELVDRYNVSYKIKSVSGRPNDPCILEIWCHSDLFNLIIDYALCLITDLFSSLRVTYNNRISEGIENDLVEELPGSSQAEFWFRCNDHQFCAKRLDQYTIINQIAGNEDLLLSSKPLTKMCRTLDLI